MACPLRGHVTETVRDGPHSLGRYPEALADLTRAIDLGAGSARTIAFRGEAYRMMEQYEQALADFSRAVDLDPGNSWAVGSRGQACQALGRHDEALADFSRAIELGADQAWIMASRGETYLAMGRTRKHAPTMPGPPNSTPGTSRRKVQDLSRIQHDHASFRQTVRAHLRGRVPVFLREDA